MSETNHFMYDYLCNYNVNTDNIKIEDVTYVLNILIEKYNMGEIIYSIIIMYNNNNNNLYIKKNKSGKGITINLENMPDELLTLLKKLIIIYVE